MDKEERKVNFREGLDAAKKEAPRVSSLGERMNDTEGMRIFKNGKWILLSEYAEQLKKSKESGDKPAE